jgi:diacylglycerol O-acyltransferase / wax synthase
MKQLSGLDASFLYLETAEMPMHIGALYLLELPPGYKGKYLRDLRRHLVARMPMAPVLQKRLWMMPFNLANPAWVDAEVNIEQHVVEVRLPKNSGLAQLQAQVSALHTNLLDRKLPLWRFFVFEGLSPTADGRKRIGVYSQLHHAAADGQAAVAIANAILDVQAAPRAIDKPRSARTKIFKIGMVEMLRGALASEVEQITRIVKALPAGAGAVKNVASQTLAQSVLFGGKPVAGSKAVGSKASGTKLTVNNLSLAPRTVLNTSVTTGRAFAGVDLPLLELKSLGRAHGATINDMVLMVCSSALRRYFSKRRSLPRKSLVAAVPISLREKGDLRSDNQASMSLITLGTHLADPAERFEHIRAATRSMKTTMGGLKEILPTDFPSIGIPWLMEAAAALYGKARVADRIPLVANLVISNVPGPPVPLYLAGAKLTSIFPTSIIVHGMGLNITVQSYDQSLGFGVMACAQAMPDVQELADSIAIAFDDIRALPLPGEEPPPSKTGQMVRAATRAGRRLTGAVSSAANELGAAVVKSAISNSARQSVTRAMTRAVTQAVSNTVGKTVGKTVRRK